MFKVNGFKEFENDMEITKIRKSETFEFLKFVIIIGTHNISINLMP